MTREEHERLYALVQNPPPGSKMEAAKVYGVDLTLNLRSLTRTALLNLSTGLPNLPAALSAR